MFDLSYLKFIKLSPRQSHRKFVPTIGVIVNYLHVSQQIIIRHLNQMQSVYY
jgi:hypothetical protein